MSIFSEQVNIFSKFTEEIQLDTHIDEINVLQKQLMLPAIKHKWVSRLIENKRKLNNLISKKDKIKKEVLEQLTEKGLPPNLPKTSLEQKIKDSDVYKKIEEEISDTTLVIEYLEKVETILRSMTYDIKNIIDINKLETT
jgi:hypothetical protein